MKYIMFEKPLGGDGTMVQKLPVIFPDFMVHDEVAAALKTMPTFENTVPVSAGSVIIDCNWVGGKSTTLDLESNFSDKVVIDMVDYHSIHSKGQ